MSNKENKDLNLTYLGTDDDFKKQIKSKKYNFINGIGSTEQKNNVLRNLIFSSYSKFGNFINIIHKVHTFQIAVYMIKVFNC